MKTIIGFLILLLMCIGADAQTYPVSDPIPKNTKASNFTGTLHIPHGVTPSLNGGLNIPGAYYYKIGENRPYYYNGIGWDAGALLSEIGGGDFVDTIYSRNDSLLYRISGIEYFVKRLQPFGSYGTVTSFSATDGNGFDFTVINPTTTPTLTATTTVADTRIMYSNAGAITGSSYFTTDFANLYGGIHLNDANHARLFLKTIAGDDSYMSGYQGLTMASGTQVYPIQFYNKAYLTLQLENNTGASGESSPAVASFHSQIVSDFIGTGGAQKGIFQTDRLINSGNVGNNHHYDVDNTTFKTGTASYNSYYSNVTSGHNYGDTYPQGHIAAFQAGYTKVDSSTLDIWYGGIVGLAPIINDGKVNNRYVVTGFDGANNGRLGRNATVYARKFTQGASNWGILSDSNDHAFMDGNIYIGYDTSAAAKVGAAKKAIIQGNGVAPSGPVTNGSVIWTESGELKVMDGAGNITVLSDLIGCPVDSIKRTPGIDSFYYRKCGIWYAVKDSSGTGGGGYTNLTQFVAQNNWKLFYSDGSGDVQELSLGTSGQYLKSNGASSVPSWDAPSGGGGSPAGNFGNIQLNRNGVFSTPGNDSLDFESATGLTIKGNITATYKLLSAGAESDIASWTTVNSGGLASSANTPPGIRVFTGGAGSLYGMNLGYFGGYGLNFVTGDATSFFWSRGGGALHSNFTRGMTLNSSDQLLIKGGLYIGSASTTPNSTVQITGSVSLPYLKVTSNNYNITANDYTLSVDNTSNNWTILLPDPTTCTGRIYIIKRYDNNSTGTLTVDSNGGNVQDGNTGIFAATAVLEAIGSIHANAMYQSNGTNWECIGN